MRFFFSTKWRAIVLLLAVIIIAISATCVETTAKASPMPDLTFVYGDKKFEYYEKYVTPTDSTMGEDFSKRKLNAPISEKIELVGRLVRSGSELKDAMLYCFPFLADTVKRARSEICAPPTEGELRFYPDRKPMFEIKRSSPGYELDEDKIYEDAYYALSKGLKKVAVSVKILNPTITAEKLSAFTKLRAKFSTSYESSTDERKHNIALALSRINGTCVHPGEKFSFNAVVGKRTAERGFMSAKIIVEGKYVEGVGGGVCQASTTLYNCALRAGMKITEVHRHSLVPTYVEPSFDAMVNGSGCDFRFKNDTEAPIYIRTYVDDKKVTVEMYSSRLSYDIDCKSVTLYCGERPEDEEFVDVDRKYTEGMYSGEKVRVSGSAPALTSEGYVVFTYSDGRTESFRIRQDEYAECAGRVAVAP